MYDKWLIQHTFPVQAARRRQSLHCHLHVLCVSRDWTHPIARFMRDDDGTLENDSICFRKTVKVFAFKFVIVIIIIVGCKHVQTTGTALTFHILIKYTYFWEFVYLVIWYTESLYLRNYDSGPSHSTSFLGSIPHPQTTSSKESIEWESLLILLFRLVPYF